jgi:hypothetical protein
LGIGVVFEDEVVRSSNSVMISDVDQSTVKKVKRFTDHFADLALKSGWDF